MTGDCYVLKFLWSSVDRKQFVRFQSETSVVVVCTGPKKTTKATETSLNKRLNEQNNGCTGALSLLCKTT